MDCRWGIDLGGTKIEGVILNADNNFKVVSRIRIPTEQDKGYRHILSQIQLLIEQLKKETGLIPDMIGMGTPGILDRQTGMLKNSNTLCLNGKSIKKDIRSLTNVPFILSNDANCFALAETNMGVIKDLDFVPEVVFGLIMGTGVGGGIIVNGKIINGYHGIGGEWGHNILDQNGRACYCGKAGCVEKILSGPALEQYYALKSGKHISLKEIYTRYKIGVDPIAADTVAHLISNFGKAIAMVINILDPEIIILGGGVNNILEIAEKANAAALPYVFNNEVKTIFKTPKLGDSAGVFGAALLV